MSVLKEVADPQSEENVQSRKLWERCLEAEKLFFPSFKRKGSKNKIEPGNGRGSGKGKEGQELLRKRKKEEEGRKEEKIKKIEEDEDDESRSALSSSSSSSSSIHPEEEETYRFLTFMDEVGLVEIKGCIVPDEDKEKVSNDPGKEGRKTDLRKDEDEDQEMDNHRDDSKDFMPELNTMTGTSSQCRV